MVATQQIETVTETYADRDAWVEARRRGIGGSDAPILLGQDGERGAADLWLDKVDGQQARPQTERMKWGIRNEASIRDGYAEDSGRVVEAPATPFTIIRRVGLPWLCFSPDGLQMSPDFEGPGVLQIKNVGADQRWKWEDGVPEKYVVQVQHEMLVGGFGWGTVVALFGGNECAWWDFQANETFQASMLQVEADFWRCVEEQRCPPVDTDLRSALDTLKRLYPESERATISLAGESWAKRLDRLQAIQRAMKDYEAEADEIKAAFQAEMKSAEAAILADGRQVTWKTQERKEYTVKAGNFRVFRTPK